MISDLLVRHIFTDYLHFAMISGGKILQVKKQLKNGVPAGEIREELKRDGYSKKEIDSCFEVKKFDMGSWWLISAILFFLAGARAWSQPPNAVFHGSELILFILLPACL